MRIRGRKLKRRSRKELEKRIMIKGEREGKREEDRREKQRWDCMGKERNMKGQSVARGRRKEIICRWEEGKQLIICARKMFLQTTTDNILDLEMLTLHNLQA